MKGSKAYYDIDERPDVKNWCCGRGIALGLSKDDTLFILTIFSNGVDEFNRCLELISKGLSSAAAIDLVMVENRLSV